MIGEEAHRGVSNHFVVTTLVRKQFQILRTLLQEALVRQEFSLKDCLVGKNGSEVAWVPIPQSRVQRIKVAESPLNTTMRLWKGAESRLGLYLINCMCDGDAHGAL